MADSEREGGLRGSKIRIEARLDGRLMARIGEEFVELSVCDRAEKALLPARRSPARKHVPAPGASRWMDGFSVRNLSKEQDAPLVKPAVVEARGKSLRQQGT